jgi:RimJ/RimL family protein N-acetyltransferase
MASSRHEDRLRVRDLSLDDIPLVNGYWANHTPADIDRMSLDPGKIPTPYIQVEAYRKLLNLSHEAKESDVLIWELNGQAVGLSTLRRIRYAQDGEIHLHMIEPALRRAGFSHRFFAMTLALYVQRFKLELIVCEPSSDNPGPNRLLQKLGFAIAKTYRTIPGPLNREHEVNRYEITSDQVAALIAKLNPGEIPGDT